MFLCSLAAACTNNVGNLEIKNMVLVGMSLAILTGFWQHNKINCLQNFMLTFRQICWFLVNKGFKLSSTARTHTLCMLSTVSRLCCTESSAVFNFNALLSRWGWPANLWSAFLSSQHGCDNLQTRQGFYYNVSKDPTETFKGQSHWIETRQYSSLYYDSSKYLSVSLKTTCKFSDFSDPTQKRKINLLSLLWIIN